MQKFINTRTILSEEFFAGWKTEVEVLTLRGESFRLTSTYQPGQLYGGFDHHGIPNTVSRPLAIWLTRQSWAVDGYLEIEGDQLIMVKPEHSFWYPQEDAKYAIAKIV